MLGIQYRNLRVVNQSVADLINIAFHKHSPLMQLRKLNVNIN